MKITEVVAALIRDGERFMICQRPEHKPRAMKWEFVGGKVEPGETGEQALARECREELDVELEVGKLYMDVLYNYPDIKVHLMLFYASIRRGTPKKLAHRDIRWITAAEIPNYSFCPADQELLRRMQSEGF